MAFNYVLKNKICDDTGKCSVGIVKVLYITIKYKSDGYDSSNTTYNVETSMDIQLKAMF